MKQERPIERVWEIWDRDNDRSLGIFYNDDEAQARALLHKLEGGHGALIQHDDRTKLVDVW